ncbi:MAG: NAD(P)-dependent oxidoreductase, partial [Candidatus Poribacteria bacterium]|nr:NAD(P)-dependent oxidoreductase [Candidatus Poribacteria bacterium]
MKILVTGATGKVGQTFIQRFLAEQDDGNLRAFCHHRMLESTDRLEVVQGSLANKADVDKAMEEITHVLHLATCKETPDDVIDVTVKGLFWLLENCRQNPNFQQFLMVGGDAAMGHFVYPHPVPVTEQQKHMPYQGCYALSKVLEEVMLEQYYIQYNLNGCCLRAPWIMEKDDFKFSLSFGEDVFGGPRWIELVGIKKADQYVKSQTIPILLDIEEQPIKRNFVHVEDLVSSILKALDHPKAFQQLFNICMDPPGDSGQVAEDLRQTRGLPRVGV